MLGSILSLVSALFFGLNNAAMRRGVLTGTALQGTSVSVPIGVPLFIVGTVVTGSAGLFREFTGETYLLLVLAGIIHFTVGRYANMRATKAMGANFVRPVQQVGVLLAVVLAITILDETLTALRAAGIILVIAGPVLMMPDRKKFRAKTEKQNARRSGTGVRFTPNFLTGFVFALISAAAFGTSPILLSAAFSGFGPWAGVAGGGRCVSGRHRRSCRNLVPSGRFRRGDVHIVALLPLVCGLRCADRHLADAAFRRAGGCPGERGNADPADYRDISGDLCLVSEPGSRAVRPLGPGRDFGFLIGRIRFDPQHRNRYRVAGTVSAGAGNLDLDLALIGYDEVKSLDAPRR